MQNLNDYNKLRQVQQARQVQQMQTLDQIQNQEGVGQPAPSRFSQFMGIAWILIIILFFAISGYMIMRDETKTQKQIQANVEAVMNTPKMQEYRAREARRQRALAQQRRLRQLGIDGVTKPTQKNDLLNEQLKKQEIAEEEEKIESQKPQGVDYTSELAAYNKRLKEVQAEEARIRREQAQAAARERERQRLEMEKEMERQRQLQEQLQAEQSVNNAAQDAEAEAQAAREKAEQERAAKIKAAQEKAAYAAKLRAQIEAQKTQRKTLKTGNNT